VTDVAHQKVNAGHLKRNAYLYVRQSTLRQVFENTESTKRQYGLRQHAVALGWPVERIVVIDSDLGQSGASAVDREGFQKLVTEVSTHSRLSWRIIRNTRFRLIWKPRR
jgi:DNA invertase Pin-like site-specific DNA recombinase